MAAAMLASRPGTVAGVSVPVQLRQMPWLDESLIDQDRAFGGDHMGLAGPFYQAAPALDLEGSPLQLNVERVLAGYRKPHPLTGQLMQDFDRRISQHCTQIAVVHPPLDASVDELGESCVERPTLLPRQR